MVEIKKRVKWITTTKSSPILKTILIDFVLILFKKWTYKKKPISLEHLRKELNNGSYKFIYSLKWKIKNITIYKQRAIFSNGRENPDLHLFKEEFDLDLEY